MTTGEYFNFLISHYWRDFQKDILWNVLNNNKVGIIGSRQIGKSAALTFAAIILACGTKESKGQDVLIISEKEDKAKKLIRDVQKHLDKMEPFTGPLRESGRGGLFDVVFQNGCIISAKPGKPTALQAYTGHVIVDEMSLTRFDTEELFAQALIVASSNPGLKTILCTNADDHGSFIHKFWYSEEDYWVGRRKGWSLADYKVWDGFPDGLPDKIKELRSSMQPKLWRKFYENQFLTGNSSFFDGDLIEAAVRRSPFEASGSDLTVIAYDPGFAKDPSGIVVARVSNKIEVLEEFLLFNEPIDDQITFINDLIRNTKAQKVVLDQGVAGIVLKQRLTREWGNMIYPVSVNRSSYNRWAGEFERLLFEGSVRIKPSCHLTIEDLTSFEIDSKKNLGVPKRHTKQGLSHLDCGVATLMLTEMLESKTPSSGMDAEIISIDHSFGKFF